MSKGSQKPGLTQEISSFQRTPQRYSGIKLSGELNQKHAEALSHLLQSKDHKQYLTRLVFELFAVADGKVMDALSEALGKAEFLTDLEIVESRIDATTTGK